MWKLGMETGKDGPPTESQGSVWTPVQNLALDLNNSLGLKILTHLKLTTLKQRLNLNNLRKILWNLLQSQQ